MCLIMFFVLSYPWWKHKEKSDQVCKLCWASLPVANEEPVLVCSKGRKKTWYYMGQMTQSPLKVMFRSSRYSHPPQAQLSSLLFLLSSLFVWKNQTFVFYSWVNDNSRKWQLSFSAPFFFYKKRQLLGASRRILMHEVKPECRCLSFIVTLNVKVLLWEKREGGKWRVQV